ncbi:hypothetical protein CSV72_02930 [Sporosarcina sp. P20a]|uniref:hypothetical protein n=1 Tax=Sporosarcina sp. P20a TaxID=2048256 RepID=UPI000C167609|nr:hypothetical protein [Sporosarcina sp. P20a]PIC88114.1 hypothetical protein CSV72_02930 [Sporosarcina sp. P20a]
MKKLVTLMLVAGLLAACGTEDVKEELEKMPEDVQVNDDTTPNEEAPVEEVEADNAESEWDEVKNKDNIIGKSNKDFKKITKQKPGDVRNDKTGNWRKVTIADNVDIEEYVLSYKDLYMKDGEVHFIINFNDNTTTVINNLNGILFVDVKEYVSKEEHDAAILGSGMELKNYMIYPDGDIEEVK